MTTVYDEDEYSRFDGVLLILQRILVIIFILFIVWIILFKIIGINKYSGENIKVAVKSIDQIDINNEHTDLGKNYSRDKDYVYYKGEIIKFVKPDEFNVITGDIKHMTKGIIVNSNNLLKIFANYNTRLYMMQQLDIIIENEKNTTIKLKLASENGMYKMKNEYNTLSQFDRNDRYNMTNKQRAKFAIMFLYIKITKSMDNNDISMKVALNKLKYFLENFDKDNLKNEIDNKYVDKIKGDIGIDNNCLYKNGKLYACFLDDIFIK